MGINEENVLALAYLGDSVYELRIRDYLLSLNIHKVNKLQKEALKYVTAKKQCIFINYFLDNNLLTEEEIDIVKRGRNKKVNSHPKNTDIVTYKWATALECLFGYLYLKKDKNRIDELIKIIIEVNL
jgi:ribonuclease-3 family protein